MHAIAVAGGAHGAGDVSAVGVVVGVEHPGDLEPAAVLVAAAGDHRVKAQGRGFGMGRIEARIQGTDLDPATGKAGGVGLVRLHPVQAPVLQVFGGAPAGGITGATGFLVGRLGPNRQVHGKRQEHPGRQHIELMNIHIHVDDFSCCSGIDFP